MGLLDKMNQLESELKASDQEKDPKKGTDQSTTAAPSPDTEATPQVEDATIETKKKVPQLKKGAGKKTVTGAKKSATNDKFKNIAGAVKKPDALANAKKTSSSSLHTHLNKTDQHGVSHKDRIEEELRLQVRKIKRIMFISVVGLVGLLFVIWLTVKIIGWSNSEAPGANTRGTSFFKLKANAIEYAHSKGFDQKKFDRVFEKFCKQATAADKAKARKLQERLLQERAIK